MNVLRKTVIIYIILLIDKLAQHESNVLRLCLVIYPVQESGTGARLHSHHTVRFFCRHRKTFTRSSAFLHLSAVRVRGMAEFWLVVYGQR